MWKCLLISGELIGLIKGSYTLDHILGDSWFFKDMMEKRVMSLDRLSKQEPQKTLIKLYYYFT